ncbi:glycosyltransferase family 4 protein [Flavobacterium sp. ALJ2]|uniref:glycosyltransferase family 4 protein n=1 Tax=Flavobacterium sp. ALJ2 TaxID=2786960 RepID=UPI00189E7939|nr:glycosyltransferase family 4 protein [Flavobacterium sp. ALJ2]MBF7090607.1 glycosyltransferase family 4 protein [Flavobacterium sp. ALJ2]
MADIKTILIAHNYTKDSFASMSYYLAHHLADLGNRVVFISHKPFFDESKIINKGKGEIIICSWPSEKRPTSIKDALWFSKLYFKYKPDVVIGHFVGANITIGISKLISINKVKTFSYYHTLVQQIILDQKRTSLKRTFLFLRKKIFYKLFCDVIVCPSELAKKDLENNYYSKKGLVILNPMKDRFQKSNNQDKNKIVISYLGRLDPSKGIVELIEAFKIYRKGNKFSNIVLNIAGTGSQEQAIKKMIDNESTITFFGGLSYDDVDDYLSEAHFTIIPSKMDALNMVGIESMMNKTPLLVSNTTGLAHSLEEGRECFKFDSNTKSMVLLFEKVERNFEQQPQMAINARNTYLTKFSMEKYCINFSNQIFQ